jgi:hypothetical protein
MPIIDFIITVFCLIDDEYKKIRLPIRKGGFPPALSDSEVLTIEIIGEFLEIDADKSIWRYFKDNWLTLFPKLGNRTTFARQAANLHIVKQLLQENLAKDLGAFSDSLHFIDGLPMPVCKFTRAHFSHIFRGEADYGYCATKKEIYYGFHGHVVINSLGVITAATFAAANIDERDVCPELTEKIQGLLIGNKGFIRPILKEELNRHSLYLETSVKENMKDGRPEGFLKWMLGARRLIETVIGQLAGRFNIEKIRARDLWHQASRFWRKLLAHTVCIKISLEVGNEPLQFEKLIN